LLAFCAFPAEHRVHLLTNNPIESTFATVRHRATRTKNCVSRCTFLGSAFKFAEQAAKSWRRIHAPEKVAALLAGTRHADGHPVPDDPPDEPRDAVSWPRSARAYTRFDNSSSTAAPEPLMSLSTRRMSVRTSPPCASRQPNYFSRSPQG
jgi:hypothetical protein